MATPDDTLWPINFVVTTDGDDISAYIVSMEYKASICSPGGGLDMEIAPDLLGRDIVPYEDVVVYIDDTKVFTGYTQNIVKARQPTSQTLYCEDPIAKVSDTWTTDMYTESKGEPVSYWMSYFLNLCQVNYSISGGSMPAPPKLWGISQCLSNITELMYLDNITMAVDANGRINIKPHNVNVGAAIEVPNVLSWERELNDFWLRNRVVVFGYNEESTVDQMNYVPELNDNGEIRTAIIASPDIYWPGTANTLAWMALNTFATPWDVLSLDCPGNPLIRIGKTVHVTDEWIGWDRYGLVTSLIWRVDAGAGYVMTVTLDEKCPTFWITDQIPTILYCATEGEGVWKTYDDGLSWQDISGNELNTGSSSYAKDLAVVKGISVIGTDDTVWAATLGGIFKTETGSAPWTNMTEEYMDGKAQGIDWWGVVVRPGDSDKVYVVGNYNAGPANIYEDEIIVGTVPARTVIYMYITADNGLTWNSYMVNPYALEV